MPYTSTPEKDAAVERLALERKEKCRQLLEKRDQEKSDKKNQKPKKK